MAKNWWSNVTHVNPKKEIGSFFGRVGRISETEDRFRNWFFSLNTGFRPHHFHHEPKKSRIGSFSNPHRKKRIIPRNQNTLVPSRFLKGLLELALTHPFPNQVKVPDHQTCAAKSFFQVSIELVLVLSDPTKVTSKKTPHFHLTRSVASH